MADLPPAARDLVTKKLLSRTLDLASARRLRDAHEGLDADQLEGIVKERLSLLKVRLDEASFEEDEYEYGAAASLAAIWRPL